MRKRPNVKENTYSELERFIPTDSG